MAKNRDIETMTKSELIELCNNQREQLNFLNRYLQAVNKNTKVDICIQESLSLMEDIEQLKEENRELRERYEINREEPKSN